MPRVSLHILYRQVRGEPGSCRCRGVPHAELSLGEILHPGTEETSTELDIYELRDRHERSGQVSSYS